jgi:hypothetical protein
MLYYSTRSIRFAIDPIDRTDLQIILRDSLCDSATPYPMVQLVLAPPALPLLVCLYLFLVVLLLLI